MNAPAGPSSEDQPKPPPLQRGGWWGRSSVKPPPLLVLSVVGLMTVAPLSMAAYGWLTGKPMPGRVMLIVFVAAIAVNIGAALFMLVRGLRLWKPLIEHNCRLCLRCHYPLPEEIERGTCPECGLDYELKATVAAWRKGGMATWRR